MTSLGVGRSPKKVQARTAPNTGIICKPIPVLHAPTLSTASPQAQKAKADPASPIKATADKTGVTASDDGPG